MALHSSILAWKIPWTEEPGRLQSMGSQRVGYVPSEVPVQLSEDKMYLFLFFNTNIFSLIILFTE